VIAVDTNVLVRLAVADDAEQARRARALLDVARDAEEKVFVPDIVLCELAWVLRGPYGMARQDVAEVIRTFTEVEELAFRDAAAISHALASHSRGDGDFADHLIAATARATGCEAVATFDEDLLELPGFVAV
jgi:predicted nucleic-acid-binding protein